MEVANHIQYESGSMSPGVGMALVGIGSREMRRRSVEGVDPSVFSYG